MISHGIEIPRRVTVQRASGSEQLKTQTDSELLVAIGTQHDHSAFTVLFNRYKKLGLNLTRSVVGNPHGGEEAFQNAMLNVWSSAHTFRTEGNARGWIMKTFVRASMNVSRLQNKGRVKGSEHTLQNEAAKTPTTDNMEKAELLRGLRESLKSLSASNRQLIAYYFMCQKNQEEIGALMDLPQSTVSYKLNESIKAMRSYLQKAGFAAAMPLVTHDGMMDAMACGVECSSQLSSNILMMAKSKINFFATLTGRVAILVVTSLTFLVGAFWWSEQVRLDRASETSLSMPEHTLIPNSDATNLSTQLYRQIDHVWDFDNGKAPKDLIIKAGKASVLSNRGLQNSGCLSIDSKGVEILLDVPVMNALPLLVRYQVNVPHTRASEKPSISIVRWNHWKPPAVDFLNVGTPKIVNPTAWTTCETFLNGTTSDLWVAGKRNMLSQEQPLPGARLLLTLRRKQLIDNLSISSIPSDRVPDVQPFLSALSNVPIKKRSGEVDLPGLKGADPKKPVSVIYWTISKSGEYSHYIPPKNP